MANLKCPECGEEEVVVGNDLNPNKCSECGYKWEWCGDDEVMKESIMFKSPQIILVMNMNYRSRFNKKLDEALLRI